jgi:uncharacterized protein with PQ loop repeat
MRTMMFIALGLFAFAGVLVVVVVTAVSNDPSPVVIWASLAGTLTALSIVLVLEFGGEPRR